MKLLYCKKCRDVFNLDVHTKRCECGKVEGKYLADKLNAEYSGDAIPFAIDNGSFAARAFPDTHESHNPIYDAWYGKGLIWSWILKKGGVNAEQIKKVRRSEPTRFPTCGGYYR